MKYLLALVLALSLAGCVVAPVPVQPASVGYTTAYWVWVPTNYGYCYPGYCPMYHGYWERRYR